MKAAILPEEGSSNSRMAGSPTKAIMRAKRLFMPPDSSLARLWAWSLMPRRPNTLPIFCARASCCCRAEADDLGVPSIASLSRCHQVVVVVVVVVVEVVALSSPMVAPAVVEVALSSNKFRNSAVHFIVNYDKKQMPAYYYFARNKRNTN